ncbi:MAG: helix-turn-helix transcriptional regulator [Lentisphaerae bacterium]|nr:helix-turn-helix transcriptional regulator [Lentisphaerota bacterium]
MLALVKKPRIELSIHGEGVDELLAWIEKKYEISVLTTADAEESVPVEETDFWREMEANRVGNLLAGARLKAGLTQARLAKRLGIRQNMISDYERGKRRLSPTMVRRFSKALHVSEKRLQYRGNCSATRASRRR